MTTTKPQMPAFSTSTAMNLIWQKASRYMHPHELEWLASGATEHIALMADSLAEMLSGLGSLIGADESGSLQQRAELPHLLFNLSYQLDEISGLAVIADDAGHLAMQALKGAKSSV